MSRSPLSSLFLNPVENRRSRPFSTPCSVTKTDDGTGKKYHSREDREQERKGMGLGWMVKPVPKPERKSTPSKECQPEEPRVQEKEAEIISVRLDNKDYFGRSGTDRSCTSYGEYEFDDGPSRKKFRRNGVLNENNKLANTNGIAKRMLTQQERCSFCFQNPTRPLHLVISVANFTYLVLPKWQPVVVPGHCYILPVQHESSMRTVDKNVWEEIRNFKKCLIMMFAKQEKGVVFLETVMGLAQQRHHCLVECIPLPQEVARQAPSYFKKAIDEAEDEWSQHDAKKLIDTSQKGLCGSIPKDFPYFHVEFGLDRGFVHVIEDEKQFKSNFGINVIRGMLRLPEEDMYRRQKHESAETQKHAVAAFAREWETFDWTKQQL